MVGEEAESQDREDLMTMDFVPVWKEDHRDLSRDVPLFDVDLGWR